MSLQVNINKILLSPSLSLSDLASSASSETKESVNSFSPHDQCLEWLQKYEIVNQGGWLKHHRIPSTLPPLTCHDFLRFFHYHHTLISNNGSKFIFSISQFIDSVLFSLGINSFQTCLVGGAVYSFFDESFVKIILDQLDPALYEKIPKECFEFASHTPHDYDFRVYMHLPLNYENFEHLKMKIIEAFVLYFNPSDQEEWIETYTFVKDNFFQKLKIVCNHDDRFLLTTFISEEFVIDIIWIDQLDVDHLFLHNSLKLYLPRYQTSVITPFSDTANGYQAVIDKMAKIIHAKIVKYNNFKAWFRFLQLQTSFYRSYDKDLESRTLAIALQRTDFIKICNNNINQCVLDHLDPSGDPVAHFCLALSACRSLFLHQQPKLASELYAQTKIPEGSFPDLFKTGDSLETHLSLLQIFGLLAHNGKTICFTHDNFQPALQFVIEGKNHPYTLLIPLLLQKSLYTLLKLETGDVAERYFNYFVPSNSVPLNLPIHNLDNILKQGLNHPSAPIQKLFYCLAVWAGSDYMISHFPKFKSFAPLAEQQIQKQHPTFHLEDDFLCSLFKVPALSLKAYEMWKNEGDEAYKISVLKNCKNPSYQFKMLKLLPINADLISFLFPKLLPFFKQNEGIAPFQDFVGLLITLKNPPNVNETVELYLNLFGSQAAITPLLVKADKRILIQFAENTTDPLDLLNFWKSNKIFNPKEETQFLFTLFLRLNDAELLPLIQREHLDKMQMKQLSECKGSTDLGTKVIHSELEWEIQRNNWPQVHTLLLSLFNHPPQNIKDLLLRLPKIPDTILLHPKIALFLTKEEILHIICSQKTTLLEKGIEVFPSANREVNLQFIALLIKKKHNSEKMTTYLLDQEEDISQWLDILIPTSHDHLIKLMKFPQASYCVRKGTTQESLQALKEEYTRYIPQTDEMEEWLQLLLHAKVAHLFPFLEWLEQRGSPLNLLTQCTPFLDASQLVLKTVVNQNSISDLAPLYVHYNLTPSAHFLAEAVQHSSVSVKKVAALVNPTNLSEWKMRLDLLVQLNDLTILQELPFPEMAQEVAQKIAPLCKEPKQIVRLLHFRNKHKLKDDTAFLTLCASFKHPAILRETVHRLTKRWRECPEKVKEHIRVLETIFKNAAENKLLNTLLCNLMTFIDLNTLTAPQLLALAHACIHYPQTFVIEFALETCYHYLNHPVNEKEGAPILLKLFNLVLKSKRECLWDLYFCILHDNITKIYPKNKVDELHLEVEELFISQSISKEYLTVRKAFSMFLYRPDLFQKNPAKEKKLLGLLFDAALSIPYGAKEIDALFVELLFKLSFSEERRTKQCTYFFEALKLKPLGVNPNHFPSKPKDHLFDYSLMLLTKLLNCDPKYIDQNRVLYEFLHVHINLLVICYKDNMKEMLQLIHKFIFLQLPSGHDISPEVLTAKWKLLDSIFSLFTPKKDCYKELLECSFFIANELKIINISPEENIKAFKTVCYRVIRHPSVNGVVYALAMMELYSTYVLEMEKEKLLFLLKQINEAVLKDPLMLINKGRLMNVYTTFLLRLGSVETSIALECLQDFFQKINKAISVSKEYELSTSMLLAMKVCLSEELFLSNKALGLSFLTKVTNALLEQGKRNRSFPCHLTGIAILALELIHDKPVEIGALIAHILLSLKKTPVKDFGSFLNIMSILHELKQKREILIEVYKNIHSKQDESGNS